MNPMWGPVAVWALGPIVLAVSLAVREMVQDRRRYRVGRKGTPRQMKKGKR